MSNLTELKATDDTTVGFTYDERGDLTDIDLPGGVSGEIGFGYDDGANRTDIGMPGDVENDFHFDPAGRVDMVTVDTNSGNEAYVYTHDANGNILSADDTKYAYDSLNRIREWFNPDTETTTSYSYDQTGNLLSVKEGTQTIKSFSYNGADQITSAGYSYDDNGNLTADTSHTCYGTN